MASWFSFPFLVGNVICFPVGLIPEFNLHILTIVESRNDGECNLYVFFLSNLDSVAFLFNFFLFHYRQLYISSNHCLGFSLGYFCSPMPVLGHRGWWTPSEQSHQEISDTGPTAKRETFSYPCFPSHPCHLLHLHNLQTFSFWAAQRFCQSEKTFGSERNCLTLIPWQLTIDRVLSFCSSFYTSRYVTRRMWRSLTLTGETKAM